MPGPGSSLCVRRIGPEMLEEVGPPPADRPHIFVCGPTPLVEAVPTALVDMVVLNGMSRYHLAAEAQRRAEAASGLHPGDRGPTLIYECEAAIARATAYTREHFEDPPEISSWTWTP